MEQLRSASRTLSVWSGLILLKLVLYFLACPSMFGYQPAWHGLELRKYIQGLPERLLLHACMHACMHAHNHRPNKSQQNQCIFCAGVVSMEVKRSTMWIPVRVDPWSRASSNRASANMLRRTASSPTHLPPMFHSQVSKSRLQSIGHSSRGPQDHPTRNAHLQDTDSTPMGDVNLERLNADKDRHESRSSAALQTTSEASIAFFLEGEVRPSNNTTYWSL